jgi:uncharacterized protein (DUF1697 family)
LMKYVCFLRGINVGGRTIRMDNLREVFQSLGFSNITTLLTSGNVIFSSKESNTEVLTKEIELSLNRAFDSDISVVIRTFEYIQELVESEPFKTITAQSGMRLHVTFLKEKTKKTLTVPFEPPQKDFGIVSATSNEVFVAVTADGKTTDAMTFLDKKFGKTVTTRNWNTVKKISALKK